MADSTGEGKAKSMNGKLAKKIRKYSKRNWIEYVEALCEWPLMARLRFAWHIIRAKKRRQHK